ncbi:MAG TPA: TonB-dependent receptor [Chthoniobacterales bacterium]|nr:TonB-dependent receptor [Chthoniobacterales bacterium]
MIKLKHFGLAFMAELAIVAMLGGNAYAQAPAPAPAPGPGTPEQGGQLQQITVTGYVIPRVGDGPQPVVTYDQEYVQKQAYQSVTDVLRSIPLNNAALATFTNAGINSSPASAAVNLRGLGINRTLTLVDGHRFPDFPIPLGSAFSFVDLNSIPLAAVDRIEILKDGASAIYGDDAVAGVVNIILKNEYNGADIYNYYGISQRGDYETFHSQLTGGVSTKLWSDDSKLSIVTAFDYYSQSPIEAIDRWYAYGDKSKLSPKYPDTSTAFFSPFGSFSGVTTGNTYLTPPGSRTPTLTNLGPAGAAPTDAFIPFNTDLAAREERYGGLVKVNFSPTNWLNFYDFLLVQRSEEVGVTQNQGVSTGDFVGANNIIIPASNPFNTTGEDLLPLGQAFNEFGPWREDVITRTIFNVVGATIQLPHSWFIDASFAYGESDSTQTFFNAAANDRLQLALEGLLPGHIGQFYDPFTDQSVSGKINGSLVDAIRTEQFQNARTNILTWNIHGGGTLIDLCSGPLTIAGGLEYRSQELIISNDPNSVNRNIVAGNFLGEGTNARRYVRSGYVQGVIPIFGDKWSWPGMRQLQVVLSERYDDYSTFNSAAKPQIAVMYKPFDDLTFRGTYSEAFVAPSLSQLFTTPLLFQALVNNPVRGDERETVLLQNGGNPNLKPEVAYEYYAELLWTPGAKDPEHSWWGWLNGFTAYVDWFQVELRNLIGTVPNQTVVNSPGSFPGSAVIFNPNGTIQKVINPFVNVGTLLADYIDFGGSYVTKEYPWGKLDLEANATYVYNYAVKTLVGTFPPGSPNAGQPRFQVYTADDQYRTGINQNGSGPDFKLVASAFYYKTLFGIDTFRTGFTLNYIDSESDVINNRKGSAPNLNVGLDSPGYVHLIGSWTTVDWQIAYLFGAPALVTPETPKPGYDKEGKRLVGEKAIAPKPEASRWGWRTFLANTTLTFGIKNIFDTRPPLSIDQNSGNGYDFNNADPIQRFFYISAEKKF